MHASLVVMEEHFFKKRSSHSLTTYTDNLGVAKWSQFSKYIVKTVDVAVSIYSITDIILSVIKRMYFSLLLNLC